jgi:hypothetical protein
MSENIFLKALDSAVSKLTASPPQNMAAPARAGQQITVEGPPTKPTSGYRGASQSGTLDAMEQSAPLSAEAQAQLHPRIVKKPVNPLAHGQHASPSQAAKFEQDLENEGWECPRDAIRALMQLDDPVRRLDESILGLINSAQTEYFKAHEAEARAIATGEPVELTLTTASTRDQLREANSAKISARKVERARYMARAQEIAAPVNSANASFAHKRIDELEREARKFFDRFGVPFTPPLWLTLYRSYASNLRIPKAAALPSLLLSAE